MRVIIPLEDAIETSLVIQVHIAPVFKADEFAMQM